jgi:hypothetical protein
MNTTDTPLLHCGHRQPLRPYADSPPLKGARGCCRICYAKHYLQVRRGKTTWAQLEAEGKTLPTIRT